jgi:hypothetical protein
MEIRIIKGPLSDIQLEDIAALYGLVDAKYKDPNYCRYLFNANPFGFSIHAFAHSEEQAVGHISLIPMQIHTPAGRKLSYKAEAFYLMEEYRKDWITWEDDELPLGLALPKALYASVTALDTAVIHLLADEEIGKIHQFAGCKQVPIEARESFLMLDPTVYLDRESSTLKRLMIHGVHCYQTVVNRLLFRPITQAVKLSNSLPDEMLPTSPESTDGWTIDAGHDFSRWLLDSPYIRVFSTAEQSFCVVKLCEYPGRTTEILCYSSSEGSPAQTAAIIGKIVQEARSRQASSVIFRTFGSVKSSEKFRTTLVKAGFLSKSTRLYSYLRAEDGYFLEPQSLRYSPYFYSQF